MITLIRDDMRHIAQYMPQGFADMVYADSNWGDTEAYWDKNPVPYDEQWKTYHHARKENGAILLQSSLGIYPDVVRDAPEKRRFTWVWNKGVAGAFLLAKKMPLNFVEVIPAFGCRYFFKHLLVNGAQKNCSMAIPKKSNTAFGNRPKVQDSIGLTKRYQPNIITVSNRGQTKYDKSTNEMNCTRKPIGLLEKFVLGHTLPGETVFDAYAGSGQMAITCILHDRNYVGMDISEHEFGIAKARLLDFFPMRTDEFVFIEA